MSVSAAWRDGWQRLAQMSWDELWTRSQQELAKRWDAARYRLGIPLSIGGLNNISSVPGRFFFEPNDLPRLATLLRERLSQEVGRVVGQAERICQHRFDLLGYRDLCYGQEIDWHLDEVHGKRAPRRAWFRIPQLNFDTVGDSKITWELNRHQHLVTLAKAYCFTREERFTAELVRQWYHWHQENPYPIGTNWACSLEVAFRSLSWIWMRHLLSGCSAVPERFQPDLLRELAVNGRHIERYLSTYFSPNTHLLGEGVALFFIGTLCPQLRAARRWQQRGWEIVLREADRQVEPDGMHFEHSTHYHVYALDFFLHARLLAERNRIPIPASFDETLTKMLEILCALGQAGAPPRFGDDDGGRVFDPQRNRAEHLLDPLATGAVLFERPDFKAASGGLREETLWLLGPQGARRFDRIPPAGALRGSAGFEASGIYVMAHAAPVARQLVIKAGSWGHGPAGHGHADALSLHLNLNGREYLGDPGTFTYVGAPADRNLFRATAAHNTLQVDGQDQAEPAGPFAWSALPTARRECWVVGGTFDLFAGSHTGYCRLPEPVVHRRWVFHLKSRFWLVRDLACGEGNHRLDLYWHLMPACLNSDTASNAIVVSAGEKQALVLLSMEAHNWSQEITPGWFSPAYGIKEPSSVLHFRTQAVLPAEFATLLVPVEEPMAEVGRLMRVGDGAGESAVRAYLYTVARERHYMFFADSGQSWELGPWASDARFVYWGVIPDHGRQHLVLCEGSYIDMSGKRAVACKHPVARVEWLNLGGTEQIFCSDEVALSDGRGEALTAAELAERWGAALTLRGGSS